mgnify:CR=1 FL=1
MAETQKPSQASQPAPAPADVQTETKTADVGTPTPQSLRILAEDLPEKDPVQQAYKDAMLADSSQDEAKAKAKVVDESPNAAETPSGAALKKVTGVSNDTERGEKYTQEKTAVRWGYRSV